MKILVLTQYLHTNYGGLLQAYALQKVLKELGHDVKTEDRRPVKKNNFEKVKFSVKNRLKILLGKGEFTPSEKDYRVISQYMSEFVRKHIETTLPIYGPDADMLKSYDYDAYIVGSDQVWRPKFANGLYNYFLDFAKNSSKKISYAASFGVDEWEFTEDETKRCRDLIRRFDKISVREESGVGLCHDNLNIEASRVLDPTLLLSKEDYKSFLDQDQVIKDPYLLCYVLDKTEDKHIVEKRIAEKFSLFTDTAMPKHHSKYIRKYNVKDYVFPSVETWLSKFYNANFILTDSFHGTVFSILFNKPFTAIVNKNRGGSRFFSLLKIFGLEKRLIYNSRDLTEDMLNEKIDYIKVNSILESEKAESMSFLKNSLM